MKEVSNPSDATTAVRRFRERQRALGLVKKDVWIRPEHATRLSVIEQQLRQPDPGAPSLEPQVPWTIDTVEAALSASPLVQAGLLRVARIEGVEPSLRLSVQLPDAPSVDVLLAIGGDQVMVETFLWPASAIQHQSDFNACVLSTHKYLPLATFSLTDIGGVPSYTLFGALDARSTLSSLIFEVQSVAEAALSAQVLYEDYLLAPEGSHD